MPKTKQTARKSTGGNATRKEIVPATVVSQLQVPYSSQQSQPSGLATSDVEMAEGSEGVLSDADGDDECCCCP